MDLNEFINGGSFIDAIKPLEKELDKDESDLLVSYLFSQTIKFYLLFKDTSFTNDDLHNYLSELVDSYSSFNYDDFYYLNYNILGRKNIRTYNDTLILKYALKVFNFNKSDLSDRERRKIVYDFINKSLAEEYMFHAFNSTMEESILKYGLRGDIRTNSSEDVIEVSNIFKKYGEFAIFNNYENYSMGMYYYSKDPIVSYNYGLKSPEWFNMFCGASHSYYEDDRFDYDAYAKRDYDAAYTNITTLMDRLSFKESDKKVVIDFFNKYWDMYSKCEPRLLIVRNPEDNPELNVLTEREYRMKPIEFIDETYNVFVNEYDTDIRGFSDIDMNDALIISFPTMDEIKEKIKSKGKQKIKTN